MEEINIYIETTSKGPRIQMGAYLYLVERKNSEGEPETEGGILLPDGERKQDGINSPGKSIGTG